MSNTLARNMPPIIRTAEPFRKQHILHVTSRSAEDAAHVRVPMTQPGHDDSLSSAERWEPRCDHVHTAGDTSPSRVTCEPQCGRSTIAVCEPHGARYEATEGAK